VRATLVLLVAVVAAVAAGVAGGTAAQPRLRIAAEHPLIVSGSAFHPRELVSVRAFGTFGDSSLHARATRSGSFRLRFAKLTGDPCVLRRLSAVGALGSRAILRLPPGACADFGPPPPPG
jgi:hypothetical protein